jgi:O-antigen ligase
VLATAFLIAGALGLALAVKPLAGLAAGVFIALVPLVLIDPAIGLALCIALSFVPALGLAVTAISPALLVAWLAGLQRGSVPRANLRAGRALILVVWLLVLWVVLSLGWADQPSAGDRDALQFALAGLAFTIAATLPQTTRDVRLFAWAFVAGALLTVLIGAGGLAAGASFPINAETGRFQGAAPDPNFLAAGCVPAIALIAGLMKEAPARVRLLGWPAMAVLVTGAAASESRGGVIAALVAVAAAVALMRGRRLATLAIVCVALAPAAAYSAVSPDTLSRLKLSGQDAGTGRTGLWQTAVTMAADHPLIGVGPGQFQVHSRDYARRPGEIVFVEQLTETPHVVHNTYLQVLTEFGAVGALLFGGAVLACISAAFQASRRFRALGREGLAHLATMVLVAEAGLLAGGIFLSLESNLRLWWLLGLGPALAVLAARMPPAVPPVGRKSAW